MNSYYPRLIILSIILIVLQVWVFSPLSLWRVATPLVYPVLLCFFPMNRKPLELTIYGFVVGMLIDYLSFTPGLNASAFTMTAFLRPYLVRTVANTQDKIEQLPLPSVIEGGAFVLLSEIMLVHHIWIYALDFSAFLDISYTMIHFITGAVVSTLLAAICLYTLSIKVYPSKHG